MLMLAIQFFISAGEQSQVESNLEQVDAKPGVDVQLTDLKLVLGPELRIVYPLILNFAVSGELELNGRAHPKWIKPKGILTFENGDVNLVATQVSPYLLTESKNGLLLWEFLLAPSANFVLFDC